MTSIDDDGNAAAAAAAAAAPPKPKQPVTLAWVSADGKRRAEIQASVGEDLLAAATRAAEACGDDPPQGGCFSGSCGVCEVELRRKRQRQQQQRDGGEGEGESGGLDGAPAVVRSCITVVPAGYDLVEVSPLPDDAIWGVDAWDT